MTYEELLIEADNNGVDVIDRSFNSHRIKGLYCDGTVALKKDMTTIEKACVLAEELGHHFTTVGNILDQTNAQNRKQERTARLWGYRRMIDISDIIAAYKCGCRNRYEVAEYIGVTEQYLLEALKTYKQKYGICARIDRYVVCFEPLGVMELGELS